MPISENIAAFMNRYMEEHHLSIMEFSEELDIGKNTVVGCLKGTENPQSDTIDSLLSAPFFLIISYADSQVMGVFSHICSLLYRWAVIRRLRISGTDCAEIFD